MAFAEKHKDTQFHMCIGAGNTWGETYCFAMCVLEEMQWIATKSIHAAEFFHGTIEMTENKDTAVLYVHGKGGSAGEAQHYRPIFPGSDVVGFDYRAQTPWEAKDEFARFFDLHSAGYHSVILIANSIGAYFSMHALAGKNVSQALFISPIVDMERLITDMMR